MLVVLKEKNQFLEQQRDYTARRGSVMNKDQLCDSAAWRNERCLHL